MHMFGDEHCFLSCLPLLLFFNRNTPSFSKSLAILLFDTISLKQLFYDICTASESNVRVFIHYILMFVTF